MNLDVLFAILQIAVGVLNKYGTTKYSLVQQADLLNLQTQVTQLEKDAGIS